MANSSVKYFGSILLPRAILFDMDGTLTVPMLDFPKLKAELGIDGRPILEALAEMDFKQRQSAEEILHRHEEQAAAQSALNTGCEALMDWIARRRIGIALITRNSRRSVATVLQKHNLKIDVSITREDGPYKPSPLPLKNACKKLNISPEEAWMVGDGQFDIEAGAAAGMRTVWISHGRQRAFETEPWKTVNDLSELKELLEAADGSATTE
jgi:HAD superfamily hydrolase (TIGR01509 family)